jgi:hypothetical protein
MKKAIIAERGFESFVARATAIPVLAIVALRCAIIAAQAHTVAAFLAKSFPEESMFTNAIHTVAVRARVALFSILHHTKPIAFAATLKVIPTSVANARSVAWIASTIA